jgi:hypothetical protein
MAFGVGFGELLLLIGGGLGVAALVSAARRTRSPVEKQIDALEDLHKAGTITEVEYEAARKKIVEKLTAEGAEARAPRPSFTRTLVGLAILAGLGWVASRWFLGGEATNRIVATVTQTPIEVYNAVENVAANSWRAVPISLPYGGRLTLSVDVKRGNEMDVFLLPPDEVDALKAEKTFKVLSGFEAHDARTFRRSSKVSQGSYYVVLRDQSLGILSAGSSDVEVRARLEP